MWFVFIVSFKIAHAQAVPRLSHDRVYERKDIAVRILNTPSPSLRTNVTKGVQAPHTPVNVDHILLADAVGASLGLQVVLRIPVRVENDDRVRRGQVDTQTARLLKKTTLAFL